MQLAPEQVTTEEVKHWKGLHLLHFAQSSCSQKVRILLREKQLEWTSHPVDLTRNEHTTEWYLGINPRGVVPVLVHDGVVHIESNDLLEYLDALPAPSGAESFLPQDEAERGRVRESLDLEDSLHMDLRTVTMGVLVPVNAAGKSEKELERYENAGAKDASRDKEIAWWRAQRERGVPHEMIREAAANYARAFETLEEALADREWLIGDRISVLEIAWFINVHRLTMAGYPLERHPRLAAHYERLLQRPAFAAEIAVPGPLGLAMQAYRWWRRMRGTTLLEIYA